MMQSKALSYLRSTRKISGPASGIHFTPLEKLRNQPTLKPFSFVVYRMVIMALAMALTLGSSRSQEVEITPLQPLKPDPGLTFLLGLKWAMEGPESPNFDKAIQALLPAAENKSRSAQLILGKMLTQKSSPEEFAQGMEWLKRAGLNGDTEAHLLLASIFKNGGPGVEPDRALTLEHLETAAKKGHVDAAYGIARILDQPSVNGEELTDAIKWYRFAAENGRVDAQMRLGFLYQTGLYVRLDPEKAIQYYTMATASGKWEAAFNLAQVYDYSTGEFRNTDKAIELYKEAADAGHADSKFFYAQKILQGEIEGAEFQSAIDYLKEAAESGNTDAHLQYGLILIAFADSQELAAKAYKSIKAAADAGNKSAVLELARISHFGLLPFLPPNPDLAVQIYTKLAAEGNKEARALLGYVFHHGEGVSIDIPRAANYYLMAAKDGSLEAQYNLGMLYLEGNGIQQSEEEAIRWLTKAADRGHPMAALNLGVLFKRINDPTRAVVWFRKAAENGIDNAAYYLGIIFDETVREQSARKESLKWFRNAARSGNVKAQYSLAYRLLEVPMPRENLVEAYQWFKVAENSNHPGAVDAIEQLEKKLQPDEIRRASDAAERIIQSIESSNAARAAAE